MKRAVIFLVAAAIVASGVLAGCQAPAEPARTPQPTWGGNPNPMDGVAIRPDGTPYIFASVRPHMDNDYASIAWGLEQSYIRRAGGVVTLYDCWNNADRQIAAIEDIMVKGIDGVNLVCVDTAAIVPVCESAYDAGYPIFNWISLAETDKLACKVSVNAEEMGYVCGSYLAEVANETGQPIKVYELWCVMAMETMHQRDKGFKAGCAESPLVTVVESPDNLAVDETAMNNILAAFTTDPSFNAIFSQGVMTRGSMEALRTLDRYYPMGDPKHVIYNIVEEDPAAIAEMREGYCDCTGSNSPWEQMDAAIKSMFLGVCCGQDYPHSVVIPSGRITLGNIDLPARWGATANWGAMQYENFDVWPTLDIAEPLGIPTPTVAMKKSGY